MAGAPMRIQRALARAGIASRRSAEALVAAGRVRINGKVAIIGVSCDPTVDHITVDGKPVDAPPSQATWLVLNKPAGVITSRKDPEKRKTVFDLLAGRDAPGLTYVGRLDFLTEGVLLLTTDGDAAHRLTHPSREVERTYVATVKGNAVAAAAEMRRGVQLDDGLAKAHAVEVRQAAQARTWEIELTIGEGRHHEVRRMCAALELEVRRLVRVAYGPVRLGELKSGMTRGLTARERAVIDALVAAEDVRA
ncbi:MAG: rRNA pseudouridine synthase [Gemmatimonadetes bacterium]|nr:rRNA pseudouridine synthase [Gemmatimonadota bacterium]